MIALHSFHGLPPSRQRVWMFVRHFVPQSIRRFYEGCISVPGQLWYADRKLLYEAIRVYKPKIVFEVGTWCGGGSTYFISQALYENNKGILHTIESEQDVYLRTVDNYRLYLSHLLPYVRFHLGKSTDVYPQLLRSAGKIDALFLDGAADSQQTVSEFNMFAPYMAPGSLFIAHDWDNEKMALLRPIIEGSSDWVVKNTISSPYSVGFAVYRRK